MNEDPAYEPQAVPYADLNPQTIYLTDGVRARKTPTGFVVERILSDKL